MDNAYRIKEMEYKEYYQKIERDDRLERERYERKIKEESMAKKEKRAKINKIIGCIFAALGAGVVGYGIYSDYKSQHNAANSSTVIHTDATIT